MGKSTRLIVFILVLQCPSFYVLSSGSPAQQKSWHKIGEVSARLVRGHESILVSAERLKSLKLKATDAGIHLKSIEVYYGTGEVEEIKISRELKPGGETPVIKLKGGKRQINKIVFTYQPQPNTTATVQIIVYGLKY